jgi:RecA-family ATPase
LPWGQKKTSERYQEYLAKQGTAPNGAFLERVRDVFARPDRKPLIKGVLMMGENVCFVGRPKRGKTFIALEPALSIAAGLKTIWGSCEVMENGPVVYLSGEGHAGMKSRIRNWCKKHGFSFTTIDGQETVVTAEGREIPFFYKASVPMTREAEKQCVDYVEGGKGFLKKEGYERPILVVIDTMARSMAGMNENDAGDANRYLDLTEGLRRSLSQTCTFLTLAHAPKDKKTEVDVRGSGAFVGGFDAVWTVEKNDFNGVVEFDGLWFKDSEKLGPFYFKITKVIEGGENKGAVLEMSSLGEFKTHRPSSKISLEQ